MYRVEFTGHETDDHFYFAEKPNRTVILNLLGRNRALAREIHGAKFDEFYESAMKTLNLLEDSAYNHLFRENIHVYSSGVNVEWFILEQ